MLNNRGFGVLGFWGFGVTGDFGAGVRNGDADGDAMKRTSFIPILGAVAFAITAMAAHGQVLNGLQQPP